VEPDNVVGKAAFRIRQDHGKLPSGLHCHLKVFRWIWLAGFKACLDFMILELRGMEKHDAADVLQKARDVNWHM